jgi:hypothetical protein
MLDKNSNLGTDASEMVDNSILWELGDDLDCESCGMSWNHAEFIPDFDGISKWRFSYSLGCYSGEAVQHGESDIEARLENFFVLLRGYPGWENDYEKVIYAILNMKDKELVIGKELPNGE